MTGSFCTIDKGLKMLEDLKEIGVDIYPIISANVASMDTRFFKASEIKERIEDIVGKKPLETIYEVEPIGPKKMLDLLLIAPCTGNTLAKICYGIVDTSVSMAAKAHLRNKRPLVLAVSTNDGLSNSAKNIGQLLNYKNVYFVPFYQDDPINKESSLIADFKLVIPTIMQALNSKQIEPILITK